MDNLRDALWVERYRPKTVQDTILPAATKQRFLTYISQGSIPNLLLCGGPGTGKTTAARAMLEQLGCEYIIINGSLSGNIATLREDIKNFASSVSIMGEGRKYVILDEADYLNATSTQPALRNFMEEYSKNCGFILTCNYRSKLMEPLQSRCTTVEFKIPNNEKADLAKQFLKRLMEILDEQNVPYDKPALAGVIKKYFPDWRKCLNEIQGYAANGKIDTGILANLTDANIKSLLEFMKAKNFTECRKWVAEHSDMDAVELFDKIYSYASEYIDARTIPALVMVLAKYSYQSAFVAHQEINTIACIAEICTECVFK